MQHQIFIIVSLIRTAQNAAREILQHLKSQVLIFIIGSVRKLIKPGNLRHLSAFDQSETHAVDVSDVYSIQKLIKLKR